MSIRLSVGGVGSHASREEKGGKTTPDSMPLTRPGVGIYTQTGGMVTQVFYARSKLEKVEKNYELEMERPATGARRRM